MLRLVIAFACFALVLHTTAHAQETRWWRAESPNFIVYGDRSAEQTREVAGLLEDFDTTLRRLTNTTTPPAPNRLHVYVLRDTNRLRQVRPGVAAEIRGFYRASAEQIAAFVIYSDQWGLRRNQVLFHEYAHHFMLHYFPHAYPQWYIEGWAEYVSTVEFTGRSASVGVPSSARGTALVYQGMMPIEHMLAPDRMGPRARERYWPLFYPQSWFATTVVLNNPERQRGLVRYVQSLGEGNDPLEAFEPAFGITMQQFERELNTARRERTPRLRVVLPEAPPAVEVRRMLPAANELLLRLARARHRVSEDEAPELAAELERHAAPYPDEPLAQIALARASMLRGDFGTARTRLEQIVAADGEHVEARYLLALSMLHAVRDQSGPEVLAAISEARRQLVAGFRVDPNYAPTLYLYATTFTSQSDPMSQEQRDVLAQALDLAPQAAEIRLLMARELMKAQEFESAVIVLRPLMYAPHHDRGSSRARRLVEAARNRQPPPPETEDENVAEDEEGGP
jgi:thioredoxin-like negative regulator of GroEL